MDLPPEAVIDRLEVAGFSVQPPRIEFEERLPASSRGSLMHIWTLDFTAPRAIEVVSVRDVYVAGEGIVFDRDLNAVRLNLTQQTPEQIETARTALRQALAAGQMARLPGPTVLCVKPGWGNYGHWLFEMLPKADHVFRRLDAPDARYLVPQTGGRMAEVVSGSLARIGIPADRIDLYGHHPVALDEVLLVVGLSNHGIFMSPKVLETLDRVAADIPAGRTRRVYVRRKSPAYRRFVNEKQVGAFYARRGYTIVSPEDLSFAAQVALFKGADRVAGTASAALAGIGFCRPGTDVKMFYPASMEDTFYWFIAQHRGLAFRDIRCEQAGPSQTFLPWDSDLRIEPAALAALEAESDLARSDRWRWMPSRLTSWLGR